jgi:thiamine biosynthesis protein ThiI
MTHLSAAPAAAQSLRRRILLHCPDITLKGRNQDDFQRALDANVRHVLKRLGFGWRVSSARGRVYVEADAAAVAEIETALAALEKVAGVSSLGAATWLPPAETVTAQGGLNWDLLERIVVDMAAAAFRPDCSFALRINRVDKSLPEHSQAIGARLGAAIRERSGWDRVDLKHADFTIHIDAYPDGLYIYPAKHRGVGGLPVGTGGRVLALLSGGIDSPVAAFMLAKRGCSVDTFHMAASHLRDFDPERDVVARLARELSRYTVTTRLHIVPYTLFDLALRGDTGGYELVLFRRFLLRCAEYLAGRIGAGALIAGDSLGQVASQTLENIAAASQPIGLPIFRPLIGMNKQEIIEIGRRIGTYEISIEPHKDCCALIGRNPRTRSRHEQLAALEAALFDDYDDLIRRTFAETLVLDYDCGDLTGQSTQAM